MPDNDNKKVNVILRKVERPNWLLILLVLIAVGFLILWFFKPCEECAAVTDGCTNVIDNITNDVEGATTEEKTEIQNGCLSFVNAVAESNEPADKQIVYTVCETIAKSYVDGIVGLETVTIYDDTTPEGRDYTTDEIQKLTIRINPEITSDEKQKAFVIKQQLFFAYFSLYMYLISFNNLTPGTTWTNNNDLKEKVKIVMDSVVDEIDTKFTGTVYENVNYKSDVYDDSSSGTEDGLWSLLKISVTLQALGKLRGNNNTNSFEKMFEMFNKKDL